MLKVLIVIALVGCGGKKATCVEGQSVACACAGGGSGAQTCGKDGAFGACTCGGSSGTAVGPKPVANSCSVEALNCNTFSPGGLAGWKLHKKVYDARNGKRWAEAICLAKANLDANDKVLAGAAHFETANAWEGIGCKDQAIVEVEASLGVRPQGRSGWKETCDYCKQLGGKCEACKAATATSCPDEKQLKRVLAKAWKIADDKIEFSIVCASGKFPEPGYAIGATIDNGDGVQNYNWRLAAVTADGKAIAHYDGAHLKDRALSLDAIDGVAAADFDGDGTDEIVVRSTSAYKYSPSSEAVEVWGIKGGKLDRQLRRGYGYVTKDHEDDSTGDYSPGDALCEGKYEVADGKLVITGKVLQPLAKFKDDKPECVDGTETYAAKGGKLVKQ